MAVNREDIYDHLAQVYLGKRKKTDDKKKKQFNAWLVINIVITVIIFTSAFYGLTAFLTHKRSALERSIIFSLHQGPLRLEYNFSSDALPPLESLSLAVPEMNVEKYQALHFTIRAKEETLPAKNPAHIIMITTYKDSLMENYNLGWDDFITKPVDIKILVERMNSMTVVAKK